MQFSTYSGISSVPGLLQSKITKSRTEVIHELYILTAKSRGPRTAELMTQWSCFYNIKLLILLIRLCGGCR